MPAYSSSDEETSDFDRVPLLSPDADRHANTSLRRTNAGIVTPGGTRPMQSMDGIDGERLHLVNNRNRHRLSPLRMCCASMASCLSSAMCCLPRFLRREKVYRERVIRLQDGRNIDSHTRYPPNAVKNTKYNVITFVPMVLFEQFRFFINFYFLMMACSQFIPQIRIGLWITYWGPLGFVLTITLLREAIDDLCRYRRDAEMNGKTYQRLTSTGLQNVHASDIRVGDMIVLHKDERIPADMILLRTSEKQGASFIRTDQLDGETDWKLRIAVPQTQHMDEDLDIVRMNAELYAEKPQKDIHAFVGTVKIMSASGVSDISLNIENTLWADTVLASGQAIACVIYTGTETRAAMNTNAPHSKVGLLDHEINDLTKVLFAFTVALALAMVVMKGFDGPWYLYLIRFVLLFSYIIPISLRVNLDMAKVAYTFLIGRDHLLPGTVVRSSTIPEELGRVSYLLSDKTGTLTKNEMIFKKLHLGSVAFSADAFDEIAQQLASGEAESSGGRQSLASKISSAVEAIAICHNVTPLYDDVESVGDQVEADFQQRQTMSYQAASPDEVALVEWTDTVGMSLVHRDLSSMTLRQANGDTRSYTILHVFPFTSESKRMGIIVKENWSSRHVLYMKGADAVMRTLVQYNDWLDEESSNMAREGLRTLVVARKILSLADFQEFDKQYHAAKVTTSNRSENVAAVVARLENDLQLLCLTGVEDALQDEVRPSLELLKNAGIKVWMLTGDKQETAICIAKSSGLFARTENVHVFADVLNRLEAHTELNALRRKNDVALVITGAALKVCLQHYEAETAELATQCTSVVCCRCSPEQKSQLVLLLKKYRAPRIVAAVGDGGNDVAMIQSAHAGIGIDAKEGKQASLAADFSITQFSHLCRLILVHGRYTYKRSCNLSQFVMHRGLIISVMQAIFSCIFYFASVSLYQGMLMVAYSTLYTCFPAFSLVVDRDVSDRVAMTFPELYRDLIKGRSLSYKTFSIWLLIALYQGSAIIYLSMWLFDADFIHVVSITFTSLVLTELITLGLTIHTWHWTMVVSEAFSVAVYVLSLLFMHNWFDPDYVMTSAFLWKTVAITAVSCVPLYIFKCVRGRIAPPTYAKVN